jgi:cyanophycinase
MTTLMAIGGAMDKENPVVMREFLRRAGGEDARIVVLPQASALADTGQFYVDAFKKIGAGQAVSLEFRQRSEAGTPENVAAIRAATGIFISGGRRCELRPWLAEPVWKRSCWLLIGAAAWSAGRARGRRFSRRA